MTHFSFGKTYLQTFTFLVAQNTDAYFLHTFVFKEENIVFIASFLKFYYMTPHISKGNCILIQII